MNSNVLNQVNRAELEAVEGGIVYTTHTYQPNMGSVYDWIQDWVGAAQYARRNGGVLYQVPSA